MTLSNVYIDILKDRLYTFAPKSEGRRSAQTALYRIVDTLARLLSPILVFTADEIWESLPGQREASVHIAEFPNADEKNGDCDLLSRWESLLEIRSLVQKALEEKRNQKVLGSSLEATVSLRASGWALDLLKDCEDQLADLFIVSKVILDSGIAPRAQYTFSPPHGISTQITSTLLDVQEIDVKHARGAKCERCWHWSETVGKDRRVPEVDERCIRQLEEGWGLR